MLGRAEWARVHESSRIVSRSALWMKSFFTFAPYDCGPNGSDRSVMGLRRNCSSCHHGSHKTLMKTSLQSRSSCYLESDCEISHNATVRFISGNVLGWRVDSIPNKIVREQQLRWGRALTAWRAKAPSHLCVISLAQFHQAHKAQVAE